MTPINLIDIFIILCLIGALVITMINITTSNNPINKSKWNMAINDLQEGDIISFFGESYKILYIKNNYIITLRYSNSHYIANSEIFSIETFLNMMNSWEYELNNDVDKYIFDNLKFDGNDIKFVD